MIGWWLSRLFSGSADRSTARQEQIASLVEGDLPEDRLPVGKFLCAFSSGRSASFYCDQPPREHKPGEKWWLMPRDDLALELSVPIEDSLANVEAKIRFEPESDLLNLLDGREGLTAEDIASLVTSQLGGLVDSLGLDDANKLLEPDEFERERLRAKLSLLLQNRGLRCTELGEFAVVPAEETTAPASEELPVDEHRDNVSPQQTDEDVWAELVEEVSTADDWERLMASIESAGVDLDEMTAAQLGALGEVVVDRRVQAGEVAARLKQIAQEARGRAGIGQPELRRLRGLDLRLDWMETNEDSHGDRPGAPEVSVKKRPWTWWILNRKRVDERLLGFLNHAVRQMKSGFDAYRRSQKFGPELVKLRRINERLKLTIDLLDTVPTLTPPRSELRPDRTKIKELVKSVERAVTPTETALAEIREVQKATPGSDQWSASCDEITAALDQLAEQLRQRRNVR